jgi:hypothetical protein
VHDRYHNEGYRVMRTVLLAAAVLFAVAGCAPSPGSIQPSYVPEAQYDAWNCEKLSAERTRTANALQIASNAQSSARTADTIGVILIGIPVASLGGDDQRTNVAVGKGTLAAIDRAVVFNECRDH